MNTSQDKPHHHGDLRAALIQAGLDILQTDGLHGLSLRKCAARAGVSHAAPAHHFDGLVGLKGAIAHHGLTLFRDAMVLAAKDAQTDLAYLKGICRGYLDFVAARPALFRLMFGFEKHEHRKVSVELGDDLAYEVLHNACPNPRGASLVTDPRLRNAVPDRKFFARTPRTARTGSL